MENFNDFYIIEHTKSSIYEIVQSNEILEVEQYHKEELSGSLDWSIKKITLNELKDFPLDSYCKIKGSVYDLVEYNKQNKDQMIQFRPNYSNPRLKVIYIND